ncbi:hypothetical protein, partial [Ralstonia mannitolilytica]|uniref:hypothetical protein n=1 Tax=Ralstonia mannitolilytica TaxID=105219 RepID=UPI00292F1448
NSRRGSPHRARLSLLTFFGKTKKVSRPRQGVKQGMHHKNPPPQGKKTKAQPQTTKKAAQKKQPFQQRNPPDHRR